jgi:hypothetical protein
VKTFDERRIDEESPGQSAARQVLETSGNRSQQRLRRAVERRVGRCAFQEPPMSLRRPAEDRIGFPCAIARHPEEPGDQSVPLRHRWARRCCRDTNDSVRRQLGCLILASPQATPTEANGINQKGASDDQLRKQAENEREEWESAPHPSRFSAWT